MNKKEFKANSVKCYLISTFMLLILITYILFSIDSFFTNSHISIVTLLIKLAICGFIIYPISIFFPRKSGTITVENNTLILATNNSNNIKHNFKIDLNDTFCQVYQDIEKSTHISTFYLKWYQTETKSIRKYQISHLRYKDIKALKLLLDKYNIDNYGYTSVDNYIKSK